MSILSHVKALVPFVPSLAVYGAAGGTVALLFTSEWIGKNVLQFVPIYNRKYDAYKERDM